MILRLKLRVYGGIASAVWYRQPIEPFPKSQSDFLISVYKNGQNDIYSVGGFGGEVYPLNNIYTRLHIERNVLSFCYIRT